MLKNLDLTLIFGFFYFDSDIGDENSRS